jgi:hypothetical protein
LVNLSDHVAAETIAPLRLIDQAEPDVDDSLAGISLDDPVRMYLREIGKVSLLSAAQEVHLAQAIEARRYVARLAESLAERDGQPAPVEVGLRPTAASSAAGHSSPSCTPRRPANRPTVRRSHVRGRHSDHEAGQRGHQA